MSNRIHDAAMAACRVILLPIIRLMLRFGVSHREFSEIAKRVYVDCIITENKGKANVSFIAARTGISRKNVGKVLEYQEQLVLPTVKMLAVHSLITNWYAMKEFVDVDGEPIPLRIEGDDSLSLKSLIRTVETDLPISSWVRLLNDSENLIKDAEGKFVPNSRFYKVGMDDEQSLMWMASSIYSFLETYVTNQEKFGNKAELLFERRAYVPTLSKEKFEHFRLWCSGRLPDLLEEFDDWLTENSEQNISPDSSQGLTGVGIYAFNFNRLPYS